MKVTQPSIRVSVGSQSPQAPSPGPAAEHLPKGVARFTPPIDIHEGPDGLTLEADLPALSRRICSSSSRTTS